MENVQEKTIAKNQIKEKILKKYLTGELRFDNANIMWERMIPLSDIQTFYNYLLNEKRKSKFELVFDTIREDWLKYDISKGFLWDVWDYLPWCPRGYKKFRHEELKRISDRAFELASNNSIIKPNLWKNVRIGL